MGTLNEPVSKLADRPRFERAKLGFFAFTGLLMTMTGLYGVTALMVTQRTQEGGVRTDSYRDQSIGYSVAYRLGWSGADFVEWDFNSRWSG
jgi:hypothetical protein